MFPMEIAGAGGRSLRDAGRRARAPTSGMTIPGFPSLLRHVRPQHQHLRRLDHHLPRGAGRLHPAGDRAPARRAAPPLSRAPGGRGGLRPRGAGALRRHRVAACDSWYRDDSGRIVTDWPGYMREYLDRTRRLDPAEFEPSAERRAARAAARRRRRPRWRSPGTRRRRRRAARLRRRAPSRRPARRPDDLRMALDRAGRPASSRDDHGRDVAGPGAAQQRAARARPCRARRARRARISRGPK